MSLEEPHRDSVVIVSFCVKRLSTAFLCTVRRNEKFHAPDISEIHTSFFFLDLAQSEKVKGLFNLLALVKLQCLRVGWGQDSK